MTIERCRVKWGNDCKVSKDGKHHCFELVSIHANKHYCICGVAK